jgi:hypothetical protein
MELALDPILDTDFPDVIDIARSWPEGKPVEDMQRSLPNRKHRRSNP